MYKRGIHILTKSGSEQRKKELFSFFLGGKRRGDKIFYATTIGADSYTLLMFALVIYAVGERLRKEIFVKVFFTGTIWNSVEGRESFGASPYMIGALVSPAIEIVIGVPVSLGIAIFGSELPSPKISTPLSFVIE